MSQGEGRDIKEEREEGGIIKREKGEFGESITIYRGVEDSGPDFSDEEIEYKDVKVGSVIVLFSFPRFLSLLMLSFLLFLFFLPFLFKSLTYQNRANYFSFFFFSLDSYFWFFLSLYLYLLLS